MKSLKSGFTEAQILLGIRTAVMASQNASMESDEVIPIIRVQRVYIQDYNTPAPSSINASIGRDVRVVGEAYSILEKDKTISKSINGSMTTVTRYKIK